MKNIIILSLLLLTIFINFNKLLAKSDTTSIDNLKSNQSSNIIIDKIKILKILNISNLKNNAMFVFMGSYSKRKYTKNDSKFGWGNIIDSFDLDIMKTVTLPTYWTSDQPVDTPFIFTKLHD